MLREIGQITSYETNRPRKAALPRSMKNLPWKTIGLAALVSLIVVALVKRNVLGLGNLTNPPAA